MQAGLGELFSIGAAACWGAGVVLYKQLGERLPPVALNLYKNAIVIAAMIPTVLLVHGTGFNLATPDHFRIVTLPPEDTLIDALGRLERFLGRRRAT